LFGPKLAEPTAAVFGSKQRAETGTALFCCQLAVSLFGDVVFSF
jgi:hypothetical protein